MMLHISKPILLFSKFFSTYSIKEILSHKPSQEVNVKGWIKSVRKMKGNIFLDLSDGSCNDQLQIVVPKVLTSTSLHSGASISVNGILSENKNNQSEIKANSVRLIGECPVSDGYPFVSKQTYHPDYLRQHLHLRPRITSFTSLLRVRHHVQQAVNHVLTSNHFVSINTPILTSNDCEGAGETFAVCPDSAHLLQSMATSKTDPKEQIFFNQKVFLTVSGQMHLEAAAHALSKVYTLGPTFRAENSKSRLHLSEFYMLEVEIAFLNELDELFKFVTKLLKDVTRTVLNHCSTDIFSLLGDQDEKHFHWLEKQFPILEYDQVVEILRKHSDKFKTPFDEKSGLAKEHEHFIVELNDNVPTFVINWPRQLKPFYMKPCGSDKVAAFDLLVPNVGELVGGSLRENDLNNLKSKIPDNDHFDWYLDLRRFGNVPTGGFGMGFERYLQFLLNISNIKDTIPYPRWPHNCSM